VSEPEGRAKPEELAAGVLRGDRRSLAKAITLVESSKPDDRRAANTLLETVLPATGGAVRVGISGPPGVGKSTLIEVLGQRLVDQGARVAVLAVDPSSARTGGSILGDKTRMADLGRLPDAFVRPSPSRGDVGGVTRRTRAVLLLCEAAGYDVVLVETVGVGQSEVAVSHMVDTFVLLAAPGGGDDLQGVKRGIIELADVIAVTKADGDLATAANRAEADLRHAVGFLRPRHPWWSPRVVQVSAVTGHGVDSLWEAVGAHRAALSEEGALDELRADQAVRAMWDEVEEGLRARLRGPRAQADGLEADVAAGRIPAEVAAARVLDWLEP
jgi:LAO/AO transport system kinase